MQHDFDLSANSSTTIEVAGTFFKYQSGTGLIRVRGSRGGFIDLLPGQGVWGEEYQRLTIQDRSGVQNSGVILAGAFDFRDNRLIGNLNLSSIETNDIGRTRGLLGKSFAKLVTMPLSAGNYVFAALINPTGSGKTMFVEAVTPIGAAMQRLAFTSAAAAAGWPTAISSSTAAKKSGSAASTFEARGVSSGAVTVGTEIAQIPGNIVHRPTSPYIIAAGTAFVFNAMAVGVDSVAAIEWYEE